MDLIIRYKKISHDQRTHIINELTKNAKTLKEVSEETQLKPSTVKAILQVYLKEGRIGKKSTRDRKVKLLNTTVIALIDKTKQYYILTIISYRNSDYAIENLQFLHPMIRINQQSSEISHNGQTLTETQQKLDQYSKQLVMMQVKDFLREKKSEIMEQLANPLAKQNFLNQLAQFEVSEQLPFQELKKEQLSAEDEQFVEKITQHLKSKVKI
ncbi:unnamed protein product (macronuclear) [Paramecium tetraurelia]|uniref:HTH arsR-type domain-containing protein n=1 Tax=Paramecium tetraurelia TaxID=5888 RepID=A0BH40_PARTE|nr:uncharacterized protein GSPATT00028892001 [Paramecium tetraurelia]CAK57857.1 unnamed protein product [Paramecium tetraurelia]|eukprot:XP_001425255.1 hypothetical protein (macronuclear) [Paramecium tetraurelia strain d4-2]